MQGENSAGPNLSVGAKVGYALSAVGVVALLAALVLWFLWRKRNAQRAAAVVPKIDDDASDRGRRDFGMSGPMEYGIVDGNNLEKPRPVYWK